SMRPMAELTVILSWAIVVSWLPCLFSPSRHYCRVSFVGKFPAEEDAFGGVADRAARRGVSPTAHETAYDRDHLGDG
ncbi:MAG: hypothetical protein ACODAG_11325, partial [Myxococcota bacterium]